MISLKLISPLCTSTPIILSSLPEEPFPLSVPQSSNILSSLPEEPFLLSVPQSSNIFLSCFMYLYFLISLPEEPFPLSVPVYLSFPIFHQLIPVELSDF